MPRIWKYRSALVLFLVAVLVGGSAVSSVAMMGTTILPVVAVLVAAGLVFAFCFISKEEEKMKYYWVSTR
jgi:hypothetical protein